MTGHHKPFYKHMYVQVLIAIAIGTLLGLVAPALAVQMRPLGDAFIKAIRMLIGPIVFATVVVGIANRSRATPRALSSSTASTSS